MKLTEEPRRFDAMLRLATHEHPVQERGCNKNVYAVPHHVTLEREKHEVAYG